jgi:hypothetical protein
MTARPRAFPVALAALALVAVAGLGLRLAAQASTLQSAKGDLADATGRIAELRGAVAAGIGPPLFDARLAAPSDQLAQRLKSLGVSVRQVRLAAATPAGRDIVVDRFVADGEADATAIDRFALWALANGRSAILQSLSATATAGGKSEIKLEFDALVRESGGRPS